MSEPYNALRDYGVTAAEAGERLRAAAQHLNPAEFEAQIAVFRPKLWKRMNRRPSRMPWALRQLGLR